MVWRPGNDIPMHFPGLRSILRNTVFLSTSQGIGIAARLFYVVIVARSLGPDLYAVLAYSQAWHLAFLPLALFGLGSAMVYRIAPDHAQAPEVAAQALAVRLLTTLLAALACLVLSRVIVPDPRAPALIALLTAGLVARALNAWALHVFAAFEANQYAMRQGVAFRVVEVAVAGAVLLSGGGLVMLVASSVLIWWAQAVLALSVVHRRMLPVRVIWSARAGRELLALAVPFFIIGLALEWRMTGTLILFRNLTPDNVMFGQFALAIQTVLLAVTLPVALATAAQPVLRRSAIRGDGKDLLFASAIQRIGLIGGAAAGLLGLVFGERVFVLLFGPEFAPSGRLVGFALWCLIPLVVGNGYPPVLVSRGQFRAQVAASVLGALVMTAMMLILAPPLGAAGAVVAAFSGFAVPPAVAFTRARQQGLAGTARDVLRPMLAIACALAVYVPLAALSAEVALLASLVTLLVATWMLGVFGPADFRQLRESLS